MNVRHVLCTLGFALCLLTGIAAAQGPPPLPPPLPPPPPPSPSPNQPRDGSATQKALEYVESGEETNPEFLERVKTLATTVRLTEGERKPITLKLPAQ